MAQPVDPKAYYGYLFHDDKKPTKVLDALLRGIANHISASLGDKEDKALTPAKLATFYKAVGGNYDSLFVDVPHPSISWIYASIGCQHTLQPTANDFEPPSVPALTTRGFVRWQAIEILLGPEEHVPFIQNAIRDFGIKNPDTGEAFPVDLPTEAFPIKPDPAIEKWHSDCATKLRERATPESESAPSRPDLPPRPKVQTGYAHVRLHRPTRVEPEYFEPRSRVSTRPLSYQHVPSTGARPVRPQISRSPSHRARQFLAPEEPTSPHIPHTRRRSFPENLNGSSPSPPTVLPDPVPVSKPPRPRHERAHSHPRHARRGSPSSDASSEDEEPPSPTTPIPEAPRRRAHSHAHTARVEVEVEPEPRFNPSVPTPPDPRRRKQLQDREEDLKRRSYQIPIDNFGKLSAPFMVEKRNSVRDRDRDRDRDRTRDSRDSRERDPRRNSRERDSRRNSREREREARSKSRGEHKVSWKDLSNLSTVTDLWRKGTTSKDGSQDESRPRTSAREDREYKRREREREREREFRDSDRDHEWESGRPRVQPRRSSHEDVLRRDRDRERDRDDFGRGQDIGRGSDRRSFRDRDRDRRAVSPIRGVDGRRYPSHA